MQRRQFIALLAGAATWPLAARAQQSERVRRIGVLMASTADDPEFQARIAAFQQGLQQLGWSNDRNVHIDTRWATTNPDDIRKHAAELAALTPDAIFAGGGTATVPPLLQATRAVPTCSCWSSTRSALASSTAWRGRVATRLGSQFSNTA